VAGRPRSTMKALKTLQSEPHIIHIAPLYIVADVGHLFKALKKANICPKVRKKR